MEDLFKQEATIVRVHIAKEKLADPYEKNTTKQWQSFPVKAIVGDLLASQLDWKLPGVKALKAKVLLIQRKHIFLFEMSGKIVIDGETYYGWRQAAGSKLQITKVRDYAQIYVYST